jgi:beta-N-acetylhexosaminidase
VVAHRAVRVRGQLAGWRPGTAGAVVVRFTSAPNIAVGPVPWGLADAADGRLGDARFVDAGPSTGADELLALAAGRPLVAVVRDAARTAWVLRALTELVRHRPDLVVVEMGRPGARPLPGVAVVHTAGAGRAAARAAVDALAGAR